MLELHLTEQNIFLRLFDQYQQKSNFELMISSLKTVNHKPFHKIQFILFSKRTLIFVIKQTRFSKKYKTEAMQ